MQVLNRARSADSKTFFKNFLSALAEPTEVPLTQEVQGEHIDEVRSVVDGEKIFFNHFFSAYTDFTDFHRLYRVLPCF